MMVSTVLPNIFEGKTSIALWISTVTPAPVHPNGDVYFILGL
jgi:hypothetical protein